MENFTNEQKAQLLTWNQQRDALIDGISILRVEEEKLQKKNKELADSNSDIENRINVILGRIEELKTKENELPAVISREVAFLESKKTTLESEITNLGKMIDILKPQKAALELDIERALMTFEVIKGETLLLDKVVDRVTSVSEGNSRKIEAIVFNLEKSLEEIVQVNKKNVTATNEVIDKVPAMLLELQRSGLIKARQNIIRSNN